MNITSQLLFPVQEGFDEDKEKELVSTAVLSVYHTIFDILLYFIV